MNFGLTKSNHKMQQLLQKDSNYREIDTVFLKERFDSELRSDPLLTKFTEELSNNNMTLVLMTSSLYRKNFGESNELNNSLGAKKQKKFSLSEETKNHYITRIVSYMVEKEPFLNHGFTIYKLAEALQLSPTYASRSINQVLGKSFRDFVNTYRVRKACEYLKGDKMKTVTIEAIAMESGFRSRTAFYNAFKRVTDVSPGEYVHDSLCKAS